jgi:hydrogenase expression/formation protein HypC
MCLAVPGKILEVTNLGISRIAKVEFGGVTRQASLDFVPDAQPGVMGSMWRPLESASCRQA